MSADPEDAAGDAAPGLLRTAVLLTGDRRAGEDLVVDVLARARPGTGATADALRAALVARSLRGRRLGGGQVVDVPSGTGRTAALHGALLHLDPAERAVLVLRRLDGLTEEEVARLLRRPAAAVRDDLARVEAGLPVGGEDSAASADELARALADLADELTWPAPTVPAGTVAAARRRRRRRRLGLALAAAATAGVLGAGVPAVPGWLGPAPAEEPADGAGPAPRTLTAAEVEEARGAALAALAEAAAVLGPAPVLASPPAWDQWLPEGRPAAGSTGQEDEGTCPPLSERLSADLGIPMGYWTGALPRGPVGCTWVPGPVPLSVGGPYDYAQVVSVGFVEDGDGTTVERLRTSLLPGTDRWPDRCPAVEVPGGGALISCGGVSGATEAPLVLAVPDARGAGVWVLSATVEWGAERSAAQVLSVLVEAVRPVYA